MVVCQWQLFLTFHVCGESSETWKLKGWRRKEKKKLTEHTIKRKDQLWISRALSNPMGLFKLPYQWTRTQPRPFDDAWHQFVLGHLAGICWAGGGLCRTKRNFDEREGLWDLVSSSSWQIVDLRKARYGEDITGDLFRLCMLMLSWKIRGRWWLEDRVLKLSREEWLHHPSWDWNLPSCYAWASGGFLEIF